MAPTIDAPKAAETAKNAAKKVPPWVWVVAVGGGLGVSYMIRRAGGVGTGQAPEKPSTDPADIPWAGVAWPTRGPVALPGGPAQNIGLEPEKIETNRDWERVAIRIGVAMGMSATHVDEAVDRYLAGDPLNERQVAIIETLLRRIGPPPEGSPAIKIDTAPRSEPLPTSPPPSQTPPPTSNQPPPADYMRHMIREGDTLYIIARFFYVNPLTGMAKMVAANPGVTWTRLCVGKLVNIPAPIRPFSEWQSADRGRLDASRQANIRAGTGAKYCGLGPEGPREEGL